MRVIEQQMLDAIRNRKEWQGANTAVFIETQGNPFGTRAEVYLHGNHIASYWYADGVYCPLKGEPVASDTKTPIMDIELHTLARWPSRTTMSRLNALRSAFGGPITCIRKGTPMIGTSFETLEPVSNRLKGQP